MLCISRAYATLWPQAFPCSRVSRGGGGSGEPVEKKELLRRGGSQLKRISAPTVDYARVEQFSNHRTTLTFLTPHRSSFTPTSNSTSNSFSFRTRYSHPSIIPSFQRNILLPKKFHRFHRQQSRRRSLSDVSPSARYLSLDSGSGRVYRNCFRRSIRIVAGI